MKHGKLEGNGTDNEAKELSSAHPLCKQKLSPLGDVRRQSLYATKLLLVSVKWSSLVNSLQCRYHIHWCSKNWCIYMYFYLNFENNSYSSLSTVWVMQHLFWANTSSLKEQSLNPNNIILPLGNCHTLNLQNPHIEKPFNL